jgi:transposase InsO family protein
VESFCGTIRYELLSTELFGSLLEAKVMIEDWRKEYNTIRWHSSLGGDGPCRLRSDAQDRETAGMTLIPGGPISGDPSPGLRG